jgi:hypothetical protein
LADAAVAFEPELGAAATGETAELRLATAVAA